MLLGPYSASGMFSRNEPALEPSSDKMEPGTGPGLFFGSATPKPNSQDTTNPTLCLTSWVTVGTMHLSGHHASEVHVRVYRTFRYGATLPLIAICLK